LETCDSSQLGVDDIQCPHPYGLEGFVADAIATVQEYLPWKRRTPPLMISSLARSGKTTALDALFTALKDGGIIQPIIISFNRNAGFSERSGESCSDSLLRMIAAQFVDDSRGNFSCTEKALEAHFGDAKVVLLIDELNSLGAQVNEDLSRLLKRMFLDRPNRYLVFSTHYPLAIDVGESFIRSASLRDSKQIQLPRCTDVNVLRLMAPQCSGLQPCRVALYSGIPSLIFLSCINTLSIRQRFNGRRIEWTVFDSELVQADFVRGLLNGFPYGRDFDVFSSADPGGYHMFPVAYIDCIIGSMHNSITHGVTEVVKQLKTYSNEASHAESGKDWECIVLLALLLRCFDARTHAYNLFYHIMLNPKEIIFFDLPSTYNTLELAKLALSRLAGQRTSCVFIMCSRAANFPYFDAMLLVRNTDYDEEYVGLKMKPGKVYPASAEGLAPDGWTSFWVRGDATERNGIPDDGWIYLDRKMLTDFLGYSLGTLYPAEWSLE
jgi:hypothetical protein